VRKGDKKFFDFPILPSNYPRFWSKNHKYLAYFNAVFRRNAGELREIGDFWGQKKDKMHKSQKKMAL